MTILKKITGLHRLSDCALVIAAYLLLSTFAVRTLLRASGTIGHHWDWTIPPTSSGLLEMARTYVSTFNPNALGAAGTVVNPFMVVLGSLGYLLNGAVVSKLLVVGVLTLSNFSSYLLIRHMLRKELVVDPKTLMFSSFLSGLLYGFAPFFYNDLVGGAVTQFATYAFAPLSVLLSIRAFEQKTAGSIVGAALGLTFLSISWQSLIIYGTILFIYSLFNVIVSRNIGALIVLSKVFLLWMMFNMYWILSFVYSFNYLRGQYLGYFDYATTVTNLSIHTPTIIEAFLGVGYWEKFFLESIPLDLQPLWFVVTVMLLVFAFGSVLTKARTPLFWSLLMIMEIALASGENSPIASVNLFFFANPSIPISFLFSVDPQRLVSPIPLSFAVLFGFSLVKVIEFFRRVRLSSRVFTLAILFLLIISLGPFFNGNLGGNVDNFSAPPGYNGAIRSLNNSADGPRVLFLPMSSSPLYLETKYQSGGFQGGDPLVEYSPLPTVVADSGYSSEVLSLEQAISALLGGNFESFQPNGNSSITIENVPGGLIINGTNPTSSALPLKVDLYASRYIEGTSGGFFTFSLNGGRPIAPGSPFYLKVNASTIKGVQLGDVLQAVLIREDGLPLASSNRLLYGINLPSNSQFISKLLSFVNVKYIILRTDVIPNFGPFSPNGPNVEGLTTGTWNPGLVTARLESNPNIAPLNMTEFFSIWRNDGYEPSLVYPATNVLTYNYSGSIATEALAVLSNLVLSENYTVGKSVLLASGQISGALPNLTSYPAPTVSLVYQVIDQNEIRVHIDAKRPFILVFGETYSPFWEAFFGVPNLFQVLLAPSIEEHFRANFFANAWYINRTGEYTVTLYYTPQAYAILGSALSSVSAVVCSLFIIGKLFNVEKAIDKRRKT